MEAVPPYDTEEVEEIVGAKRKQKKDHKAEAAERRAEKLAEAAQR